MVVRRMDPSRNMKGSSSELIAFPRPVPGANNFFATFRIKVIELKSRRLLMQCNVKNRKGSFAYLPQHR